MPEELRNLRQKLTLRDCRVCSIALFTGAAGAVLVQ